GEKTVIGTRSAVMRSAAGMVAVSEVALTNVVTRSRLFQRTTDDATKFVPVTVSVNVGPPTVTLFGVSAVMPGVGLRTRTLAADEVPPPGAGEKTVTGTVPAVATSAAGMVAVKEPALTNVVARSAPFQRTTDDATKFVPPTVRVMPAPPALVLVGFSVVM